MLAFLVPVALAGEPADEWPDRFAGQCQPADPHFDLEILYAREQFQQGLALATERLRSTPSDVDLIWMKARFMYEIGERFEEDTDVDRVDYYKRMLSLCEEGLAIAPDNPHLRFCRGVAMGRLGTSRGVLASLFMAKDIEQDWLKVVDERDFVYSSLDNREALPCDVYHGLGMYYRLLPDWWIVKVLAGTRGSLDKSLEYNTKAVTCKPKVVENWLELAATQYCMATKTKDDALKAAADQTVTHALTLPATTDLSRIDRRHLQRLRDDPSLGCGYSRDGQQELDEKKLEKAQ